MKTIILVTVAALTAWFSAPALQASPAEPVTWAAPAAPDIDPWEWLLPKRKNESCQPLTTCACVPDRSSAWCIQSGLSCKDADGTECQWPPQVEPVENSAR